MRDRFAKYSKNKKVYIIPTRFGLALFISVLFMLLAGAAYGNNLVNLLGFFLAAIGFVTMIQTHNNIKGVQISAVQMESGYANTPLRFHAIVESTDNLDHYNLEAEILGFEPEPQLEFSPVLYSRSKAKLSTSYRFKKRGLQNFKQVRLSTVYPLGLFYSWSIHRIDDSFYVYPTPAGNLELPNPTPTHFAETGAKLQFSGEDYREHRAYQSTDSARHVDWRAFARGRPLLTKKFDEGGPEAITLNLNQTPQDDLEEKLSQLSLWIELAHRSERSFSLLLPNKLIDFGRDNLHAHRCWQELAKYGKSS